MSGCMEATIRCNKNIIAKFYVCAIKNNGIVIGKKIFSNFNVVSVIAPERSNNTKCTLYSAEQLLYKHLLSLFIGWAQLIELKADIFCPGSFV